MKRTITIDGITHKVVDTLGYQAGHYVVEVEDGRMAVSNSRRGPWRFWSVSDRLQPRGNYIGQEAKP